MSSRSCLLLALSAIFLLLQGCTLSQTQIRRADAVVAASTPIAPITPSCQRPDHCAIASPLLDAADQALATSTKASPQHVVALLDLSEPALVARLNMIRAARRTIDVQTYIWDEDDLGQLVLDELVQAARRGVKVRILADQLNSFDDMPLLGRLARVSPNLEVRLYNPTFHEAHTSSLEWAAGIACCFMHFNQRMHNKVIVVDAAAGITGGRNYEDRYFDWDDEFDYIDRDVFVGGPAAQAMANSFALFWRHKRAVPLTHLRDVNHYIVAHPEIAGWPAPRYVHPQRIYRVQQEADDADWLRMHVLAGSIHTGNVEFFSDLPAKTEQPLQRDARDFTRHVMQMVGAAQHEVILQTPYLVMSKRARRIFERLHQQNPAPHIVVSTNSLASTDAFAVYAISYKHRKRYLKDYGFEIYELKPHAIGPAQANAYSAMEGIGGVGMDGGNATTAAGGIAATTRRRGNRVHLPIENRATRGLLGSRGSNREPAPLTSNGRRFGLHAKSIVVDDNFAMVGSHNFDPRSDHYNTEAGVIVYDRRFADRLRQSILRDTAPQNAWVVAPRRALAPLLGTLNDAIGTVSESLPLFDFWPYRYATSYALKDGCSPMRPSDPAFLSCYEPVGDFPDVALSPKLIYTRLITAFGVGASGTL